MEVGTMYEDSTNVPQRTYSRRSLLKAAAIGAGMTVVGSPLAGCGKSTPSSTSDQTVRYWSYTAEADRAAEDKWFAMFPKAHPGAKVQKIYVPSDQMTAKVIGSAASRSGPDAFEQSGDLDQLVPAGVVADLTPYLDSWPDKAKLPTTAVGRRDGKVYSVKPYSNLIALWYNADVLDKMSIAPPTTFDELGAALAKLKQAGYVGLAIAGDANLDAEWQARPFYSGFGFDYLHPEVAPLQQTFELFTGWLRAGYLPPDIATWNQLTSFPRFTAGNVVFCVNGNWQMGKAKSDAKFRYGVTLMPKGPKGGTVYLGGEEFCIGRFARDPKLAWDFITSTVLSRDGGLVALDFGSVPNRTDLSDAPEMRDPIVKAFQAAVQAGTEYPDPGLGTKVSAVRQVFGQSWNGLLAGQKSPQRAAQDVVDGLQRLLHP
jgi:multiple sugar transport system substrate-binding protein